MKTVLPSCNNFYAWNVLQDGVHGVYQEGKENKKSAQILNLEEENFYKTVDSSRSETNFEINAYDIQ